MDTYTTVVTADDVTDEVLTLAEDIYDGWFLDTRIDWADFIDRLEGGFLRDGSRIDMGTEMDSPAIAKIKRHITKIRKEA